MARGGGTPTTARTATLTAIAYLALPLSSLVTGPILARALGPEDRGVFAAVGAPLTWIVFLLAFGLPEAIQFQTARGAVPLRRLLRTGAVLGAATGVLAGIVLALLAPVLLADAPSGIGLLQVMCLTLPPVMALTAVRAVAAGRQRFDLIRRERWLAIGGRLVLITGLAVAGTLTVATATYATFLTGLVALLVVLAIVRTLPPDEPGGPSAPLIARRLLTYGARVSLGAAAGVLVLRLDQTLMVPLAGARELGYYAVAVSLADVPLFAVLAVKDVVFSASMARADPGLIASASRACVVLLIAVGLVSAAAAPVALPFVFGEDFAPAVPMAQLLILATIPSAVESVVGAGLLSLERPGIRSIAQVGGLVVNVAIVVVLVPVIGGEGAALATIAGYTVVATVVVVVFSRAAGLPAASCFVPRPADAVLLVSRLRRRG